MDKEIMDPERLAVARHRADRMKAGRGHDPLMEELLADRNHWHAIEKRRLALNARAMRERAASISADAASEHKSVHLGFHTGLPLRLTDINAELEERGLDLVLVVGYWDGEGEPEPTTLELMTPAEFERRCELVPGHDQSLSGIAAEAAQVSVIPLPGGRGVSS